MTEEQVGDRELWARATAGEPECFGVLFDRHGAAVRSYCARRTGSMDVADDLVSVVFLEAWRRRSDVVLAEESALPWLYGIAHHTVQRRLRNTIRHRRALAQLPADVTQPDHADDLAGRLDDRRQLAELTTALGLLRGSDQDVLVLCVWQGLDYAAAAVSLGIPVGTVRSRLSRARARLHDETTPPAELGADLAARPVTAKLKNGETPS